MSVNETLVRRRIMRDKISVKVKLTLTAIILAIIPVRQLRHFSSFTSGRNAVQRNGLIVPDKHRWSVIFEHDLQGGPTLRKEFKELATERLMVDTPEFKVPQLRHECFVVQPVKCAIEAYALGLLALDDCQSDRFDIRAVLEDRRERGACELRRAVESNDL
jgi:hypothetical protein